MTSEKDIALVCWVIIIILGIAAYMFIRGRRKVWAGSVLPLMLVPFLNIIYAPMSLRIARRSVETSYTVRIVLFAIAFLIVCFWVAMWAKKLPAGKSKYAYIIVANTFTFLLILLLLRDTVLRPYFHIF